MAYLCVGVYGYLWLEVQFDDAHAQSVLNQFSSAVQAELFHNPLPVGLHRVGADIKQTSYIFVGTTLCEQRQNSPLAVAALLIVSSYLRRR